MSLFVADLRQKKNGVHGSTQSKFRAISLPLQTLLVERVLFNFIFRNVPPRGSSARLTTFSFLLQKHPSGSTLEVFASFSCSWGSVAAIPNLPRQSIHQ